MLSAAYIQKIETELSQQTGRILTIQAADETLIIKRQIPAHAQFGYSMLNMFAKLLRQPVLCAVPAPGGAAAQAIEIQRLNSLKQAGIPVPEVRHIAANWFAMTLAGSHSIDELIRTRSDDQLEIWQSGLKAILQVHQVGQNLSQAFARNIMWQAGKIQFIDFEDDPAKTLPLAYAQSRDWLLYIHSTAYLIDADASQLARLLHRYLVQDQNLVSALMQHCSQQLAWLRCLPKQRKPWGRDVISLQGAGGVLYELSKIYTQNQSNNQHSQSDQA